MAKYEYSFPVDDLDEVVNKINMGIIPSIPEEMMVEVRIREKELRSLLFDDDDDDMITEAEIKAHKERMEKKMEENRHKAHREDIKVIKIGPKARARLEQSVSASLVRPDVTDYVKSDEELYSSEKERKLLEKMARIKSRYQNSSDFRHAMEIIREYIEFKLVEENRNRSKDEVFAAFHAGQIKLNIRLPKLFSDFVHEITDPKILADVASGKVTLKSKSEVEEEIEICDYTQGELTENMMVPITGNEYNMLLEEAKNGEHNILTPILRSRSTVFKYALPTTNQFSKTYGKPKHEETKYIPTIDYCDTNQSAELVNKISGFDPTNPNNVVAILNEENGRNLTMNTKNMITQRKESPTTSGDYRNKMNQHPVRMHRVFTNQQLRDPATIATEQSIIGSISAYDYNPY